MDSLRFTIPEILSLLGVAQCLYLLVYMLLRSGSIKSVFLPALYFLVLAAAFTLDFGRGTFFKLVPHYNVWAWALWFMGPPLSVLLILQILKLPHMPSWKHFWILLLLPVAYLISAILSGREEGCLDPATCHVFQSWLVVTGLLAGLGSMTAIWFQRPQLSRIKQEKAGRDRYWLILTLVLMNLLFLGLMLMSLMPVFALDQITLARTLIGLGFVYVAGTSLFRIYPQAVLLIQRGERKAETGDDALSVRIRELMDVQKIYQEPTCNRATLARELNVPEGTLSRVINVQFGKSVPQLLNEFRVADAQRLLQQTDAPIKIIAEEVGFSSLASFNRVFKDMTGESPSAFRGAVKNTPGATEKNDLAQ